MDVKVDHTEYHVLNTNVLPDGVHCTLASKTAHGQSTEVTRTTLVVSRHILDQMRIATINNDIDKIKPGTPSVHTSARAREAYRVQSAHPDALRRISAELASAAEMLEQASRARLWLWFVGAPGAKPTTDDMSLIIAKDEEEARKVWAKTRRRFHTPEEAIAILVDMTVPSALT